jgi:uncharacterized protein (DUF2384 family)
LLYEMLIAIGIAVVLVVAAIDRLVAWVMMGPDEMALLRLARAATAQRRLVASAAQQEREARAATAQRRLVASAAQQERADDWIRRCLKRQYEDALAAPLSPRLATLITQLETQAVSA